MSRTVRNRHTTPHGWVVRDDGYPYLVGEPSEPWDNGNRQAGQWYERFAPYRRSFYRCEAKDQRKPHYRRYRHLAERQMRQGEWDDILPYRRTSGRLSW